MSLSDIIPQKIATLDEAKDVIEELIQAFVQLQQENEALRAENAQLKGQPKKPRFPSGQPVSSSVSGLLQEKKTWQKRSKKGKIPIDQDLKLSEVEQCVCGGITFQTLRTTVKIVQGIIFVRNNIAYHGRDKQCLQCGKTYQSILPENLRGVSFDPALGSFVSFLKFGCRMTYPLLHRFFSGLGIQISYGEINELLLNNSDKLQPAIRQLKTVGLQKSKYVQSDATGSKRKDGITGKVINQYAQVISNKMLSVFAITRYYNAKTLNRLLGKAGREKPFIGDDGSPNGECLRCKHKQVCWVHEIRHYKKLFAYFTQQQQLRRDILLQWSGFYHMAKHYGDDPPRTATKEARAKLVALFDQITTQGTGYKPLDKQLMLTRKKRDRLLMFLNHPGIPIHNNQCEQDLREYVIQRKISGPTKSGRGDRSIARHLSVIQTARKQRLDVFQTLHGLLSGQLTPAVLTTHIS